MEKVKSDSQTPYVAGVEQIDSKQDQIAADHKLEHDLTVRDVIRNHPKLVWWCFYWAMASVGWGFDAQINGAAIAVESFRRDFGYIFEGKPVLPANWQIAFNTVSSVGQFFGCFLCSWLADRIGRKRSLYVGLALATGGIFGEMFSSVNAAFVVSKLILGFGLGFYLTLAPMVTSEISPVVLRGITTAGVNLGIAIGQLLSNAVIKGFGERTDHWAYRGPFACQLFFCVFLLCGLPFAPDTPWFLLRQGRRDDARKAVAALYGTSSGVDLDAKLAVLERTIAEESASQSEQGGIRQCFKGTDRLRTCISMGVFVCQHLVGIVFILGFSTYFFQIAGLETSRSFDMGVGVTACGVFGNFLSWFVVNRFGRRSIFLLGMVSLVTLLFLIGILDVVPTAAAKWVQSGLTVVWAFVYFATLGAMAFAVLGETSSTRLRAPTMALATATQAIMGIIMNFVIPYMVNPDEGNLKGKVGFIFGGLGALAAVWSWFYVPELKGRTFDEIDRMFQERVPPRKMGGHVLTTGV
ncbi:general substrate transporter [Apiospora arundinis]